MPYGPILNVVLPTLHQAVPYHPTPAIVILGAACQYRRYFIVRDIRRFQIKYSFLSFKRTGRMLSDGAGALSIDDLPIHPDWLRGPDDRIRRDSVPACAGKQ